MSNLPPLTPEELADTARAKAFKVKYPDCGIYAGAVTALVSEYSLNCVAYATNCIISGYRQCLDPMTTATYIQQEVDYQAAKTTDHRECEIFPAPDFNHGNQRKE